MVAAGHAAVSAVLADFQRRLQIVDDAAAADIFGKPGTDELRRNVFGCNRLHRGHLDGHAGAGNGGNDLQHRELLRAPTQSSPILSPWTTRIEDRALVAGGIRL
ncbi:hypothetical protein D9M72_556590 [compost metagenome]